MCETLATIVVALSFLVGGVLSAALVVWFMTKYGD
jgi:hypothetical protein